MPRATIASRQLKNKDTGLDLAVPSYSETKGLMSSTVYYQVVLVSNLACFKLPSHKESDVVQYSIEKQWSEFEDLRVKVAGVFQGTSLPILNKISIIVNDNVLRQRRNNLDQLMKFIASIPKLASCAPVLEFLGVEAGKARRFSQGEHLERSTLKHSTDGIIEEDGEVDKSEVYVFEENDNDQTDDGIFGGDFDDNEALFGTETTGAHVSMFEKQDMKGEIDDEDEKHVGFVPDAIITKRETIQIISDETDLLTIDDDLDKLMTADVSKTVRQPQAKEKKSEPSHSPSAAVKPVKPSPAPKPKPAAKLNPAVRDDDLGLPLEESSAKPGIINKPKPAQKPRPNAGQAAGKPESSYKGQEKSVDNTTNEQLVSHKTDLADNATKSGSVDTYGQDDILKYLRENSSAADDVDLFS